MRPQKKVIDAAIRSGALPAVDRLLSAAHLLTEIAAHLTEEADDRARSAGLMLGEVKHFQRQYQTVFDRYHRLWTDLARESGMRKARREDFDTYLPAICRMLGIAPLVTEPSTGRTVPETAPEAAAPSAPSFHAMDVPDKPAATLTAYSRERLTEAQREALGEDAKVTFLSHANLSRFYTLLARDTGTPKRDLLNRAIIEYMDRHAEDGE